MPLRAEHRRRACACSASACALPGIGLVDAIEQLLQVVAGRREMRPPSAVRRAHSSMRSISAGDIFSSSFGGLARLDRLGGLTGVGGLASGWPASSAAADASTAPSASAAAGQLLVGDSRAAAAAEEQRAPPSEPEPLASGRRAAPRAARRRASRRSASVSAHRVARRHALRVDAHARPSSADSGSAPVMPVRCTGIDGIDGAAARLDVAAPRTAAARRLVAPRRRHHVVGRLDARAPPPPPSRAPSCSW